MQELSIVVFAADLQEGTEMTQMLSGIEGLTVPATVTDGLAETLAEHQPDAFFVGLGVSPHRTLDMIDELPGDKPPFFLSGGQDDTSVLLRSMRMGVVEFLADLDRVYVPCHFR